MKTPRTKATHKVPRKNDPQGLRTRILDVAAEMFQVRGYFSTSMQDLMQGAEVSGGALHHHFASKKALGLAVILERVAPAVRETWVDPVRTAASLPAAVSQVFAQITAGIEARGRVAGCPLNNLALELALADPEFRDAVEAVFAEWRAALGDRIGSTPGGVRLDRSRRAAAAMFIISTYSGAMTQAKTSQSAAPLRSAADELTRWIRERNFGAVSPSPRP
ncbi:MAG: TetR/AcrR family transcriptional regulator [Steroidobacteraceae bacterium]